MNSPIHRLLIATALSILLISCAQNSYSSQSPNESSPHNTKTTLISIGEWKNLYSGDTELAGVELSQYPREGPAMRDDSIYDGKHPSDVVYHFWDGRIRDTGYDPSGTMTGDQWLNHDDVSQYAKRNDPEGYLKLKEILDVEKGKYIASWGSVDFSFGSDPHFKHHKNPIRVLEEAVEAYRERLPTKPLKNKKYVEQAAPSNH